MIELSEHTIAIIWRLFAQPDWLRATAMLESECGDNLPLVRQWDPTPKSMERLRFATLKLSGGNIEKLREALDLAKRDWRDLLVAAGFGGRLDSHRRWAEELLSCEGKERGRTSCPAL